MLRIVFPYTLDAPSPNNEFIPFLLLIIPVFGNPSISNADQYYGSMKSKKLTEVGVFFCGVFQTFSPMTPKNEFLPYLFHNSPVFEHPSVLNTDQYLGSMESQTMN